MNFTVAGKRENSTVSQQQAHLARRTRGDLAHLEGKDGGARFAQFADKGARAARFALLRVLKQEVHKTHEADTKHRVEAIVDHTNTPGWCSDPTAA